MHGELQGNWGTKKEMPLVRTCSWRRLPLAISQVVAISQAFVDLWVDHLSVHSFEKPNTFQLNFNGFSF